MSEPTSILVLDDFDDAALGLAELLVNWGHDVRVTRSLAEAREALAEDRVGLLLFEPYLESEDGLEIVPCVRALPDGEKVRIVALSTQPAAVERVRCLEAGCDAYWTKPIPTETLRALAAGVTLEAVSS